MLVLLLTVVDVVDAELDTAVDVDVDVDDELDTAVDVDDDIDVGVDADVDVEINCMLMLVLRWMLMIDVDDVG